MLSLLVVIAAHGSPVFFPDEPELPRVEAPDAEEKPRARTRRARKQPADEGIAAARTGILVALGASAAMGIVVAIGTVIFTVVAFLPALAIGGVYNALIASGGAGAAGAPLVLLAPMILPIVAVVAALALSVPLQVTASVAGWSAASLIHGWRSALATTVLPSVLVVAVPAVAMGMLAVAAALGGTLLGLQSFGGGSVLLGPLMAAMLLFPVAAVFSLVAPLMTLATQGLAAMVLGMSMGARGRAVRPQESAVNLDLLSVPE